MIGMKGFLICGADRAGILDILQNAGIDALARDGAMLHIFSASDNMTVSELNSIINENTQLPQYAEFVHSKDAIKGFMLILQNAFGGLLLTVPLSSIVSSATLTTTGVLMPAGLPFVRIILSFAAILLLLTGFIVLRTRKIG